MVDPLFILLVDNDHDELKSWLEGEGPPGENPKLFLFQVQLRRPTTILLMIAHLGKIPTLRKTSLISASICTNARAPLVKATSSHNLKKSSQLYQAFNHTKHVFSESTSHWQLLLVILTSWQNILLLQILFSFSFSVLLSLCTCSTVRFPICGDFKRS